MRNRIIPFFVLLAAVNASGCLTIQKKSMVVLVPPASKEVHMYYVFEGKTSTDSRSPISVFSFRVWEATGSLPNSADSRTSDFSSCRTLNASYVWTAA
jgi:hypothetical protein